MEKELRDIYSFADLCNLTTRELEAAKIKDVHNVLREALPEDGDTVIAKIEQICGDKREGNPNVNSDYWKIFIIWILAHASKGKDSFSNTSLIDFLNRNGAIENFLKYHVKLIFEAIFKDVLGFKSPEIKKPRKNSDTWKFSEEITSRYSEKEDKGEQSEDSLLRKALTYEKEKRHDKAREAYIGLGELYHRKGVRFICSTPLACLTDEIDLQKATEAYAKALEHDAEADNVFESIIKLTEEIHSFEKSMQETMHRKDMHYYLEHLPTNGLIIGVLCELIKKGRDEKAAELLKKLVRIDPKYNKEFIIKFAELCIGHKRFSMALVDVVGLSGAKTLNFEQDFTALIKDSYDRLLSLVSEILGTTPPDKDDFRILSQIHMIYTCRDYKYEFFGPNEETILGDVDPEFGDPYGTEWEKARKKFHSHKDIYDYLVLLYFSKTGLADLSYSVYRYFQDADFEEDDNYLYKEGHAPALIFYCGILDEPCEYEIVRKIIRKLEQEDSNIAEIIKTRFRYLYDEQPQEDKKKKPYGPLGSFEGPGMPKDGQGNGPPK